MERASVLCVDWSLDLEEAGNLGALNVTAAVPWQDAINDVEKAIKLRHLTTMLAGQDIAQRYRRSRIGAFWLTINMGVFIGALGLIFGMLFRASMHEYLPFVGISIIIWGFITANINEGCGAFSSAEGIILQVRMPLSTHVFRIILRNSIIFFHNLIIFPLILIAVGSGPSWSIFWAIPGFVLLSLNMMWIMLILSVICTRFRDLSQIIQNVMQVLFYLTPLMWMPKTLPDTAPKQLIELNPFYHLVAIVRDPLLGSAPSALSWWVCLVMLLVGAPLALWFFGRYRRRIAYWL